MDELPVIEIDLNLQKHCIETEVKRLFNQFLSQYFKATSEEKRRLEEKIDLLKSALDTFDFSFLRDRYAPLAGGGTDPIVLSKNARGQWHICINGRPIAGGFCKT
jgi:hypothetical protein